MAPLMSLREKETSFDYVLLIISIPFALIIGLSLAFSGEKEFFFITPIYVLALLYSLYLLVKGRFKKANFFYITSSFLFFSSIALLCPPDKGIWLFIFPLISTIFFRLESGLIMSLFIMAFLSGNIAFRYVQSYDINKLIPHIEILTNYIFFLIIVFLRTWRVNTYIGFLERISPIDIETGAISRYQLEEEVEQALSMLKRYSFPSLYIAVDLKELRKLEEGKLSDILAELVSGIKERIRKSDFIARYSRNIFVIQLTSTNSMKAKPAIERIANYLKNFSNAYNLGVDMAVSNLEKDDTFDTLMEKLFNQLKRKEFVLAPGSEQ